MHNDAAVQADVSHLTVHAMTRLADPIAAVSR